MTTGSDEGDWMMPGSVTRMARAILRRLGLHSGPRARINGQVRFECDQVDGGFWIAECDQLNLTISAETFSDLVKDLVPTLDAMFEDLQKSGDLERFLAHRGLTVAPADLDGADAFDLPFSTAFRHDPAHALAV